MASILLADDDPAVRDLVGRALTADGHKVHVTQDGAEALEYLEAHSGSVDLLVTDVDMPQLDGVALARKAVGMKPGLAIVLMSGHSDQLGRADGIAAKRIVAISKPFTLEQIRQIVKSSLA